MKILLLNPPFKKRFSRTSRSPSVTRGGTIYYPFWLAYTAGVLDKEGFDLTIIDAPAENYNLSHVLEKTIKFQPQLIVIDTSTPSIFNDIKVAERLKKLLPNAFIVLVGTHPSAVPEETLGFSNKIDAVAKGEYDYTIRDLAYCLKNKDGLEKVDGLIFRKNSQIIINQPRILIENLDEIPFVSQVYKKYFNIKKYFFAASDYPFVMMITGRGCPFRCFFCVYPQTFHSRKYRFRSPENVVKEFEYIVENLPEVKEIGIEDDTFTADRKRTVKICQLLIERQIKMKWYCNVRADLDLATMKWMKKAGCHLLTIGFESGNQNVLNNIHKGITIEQIKEFTKNARKTDILVHGCFMAGNPGETKETLEETLTLAKEINCDSMQFYPLIVYPGTEAYQWAKENKYLISSDYRQWATKEGMYNCILNFPHLSSQEILNYCNRATREYYLRPAYILMKIKQMILHPQEIGRTIKSAKTFFKYL
ncbi:B12-binding domain-containing radical SAM protein [Patescibacteria group bacterium]|nr:B12-binding domain-containing radical SAM protein [Patescibacteria group bacterium]MBU2579460.1 B12-binding domain-containing radical SAM protein [Patescibacteria group bacterium]MCG2701302.1 B12-binding domain-containing radical SAM protein [Candidatus Parcubacteria bacterium]